LFLKNSLRSDIQYSIDSMSTIAESATTKFSNNLALSNKINELNQSIIARNKTFQLLSFCDKSKCYLLPIYLTKGIIYFKNYIYS